MSSALPRRLKTASALAITAASPTEVSSAAADGARAWWQFLDDRQTAA